MIIVMWICSDGTLSCILRQISFYPLSNLKKLEFSWSTHPVKNLYVIDKWDEVVTLIWVVAMAYYDAVWDCPQCCGNFITILLIGFYVVSSHVLELNHCFFFFSWINWDDLCMDHPLGRVFILASQLHKLSSNVFLGY